MKKNMFKWRWLVAVLAAAICVSACSDSDDEPGNGNGQGQTEQPQAGPVEKFDDLDFFQNSIVSIDSLGNFVERNYGEPLYDNDTTQLYIGVDNIEEAYEIFKDWLAPDVQISTQIPTTNNVIVTLTDEEGAMQGEVYFKAGTESGQVAQVTTDATTKHFKSVTFIYNSAWPYNANVVKHTVGAVYPMTVFTGINSWNGDKIYKAINMVCIRSSKNGIPPLFMGISKELFSSRGNSDELFWTRSSKVPDVIKPEEVEVVKKLLTASDDTWNFFVGAFEMAGNGPLDKTLDYWVNYYDWCVWWQYHATMNFSSKDVIETHETLWTPEEYRVIYLKKSSRLVGNQPIQYVERSWDAETQTVKSEEKTINRYYYIAGEKNDIIQTEGDWYAVTGPNVRINTLVVKGADTHLILADGAKLTVNHVEINAGAKLTIHGGPTDSGKLIADNTLSIDDIDDPADYYEQYHEAPGIGSCLENGYNPGSNMGTLVVMGGDITAKGYAGSAGIGGANGQSGGVVQVYGGRVIAHGDELAAGIGGGDGGKGGTFEMYGGYVEGHGGADGAGIGGGEGGDGGSVRIYGGTLWAWGYAEGGDERHNSFGAGIGGGQDGSSGDIEIHGGDVKAYGGEDAAGIGGGEEGSSGVTKFYGGNVYAEGKNKGTGIGAGVGGDCFELVISGGVIHALGGENSRAIGIYDGQGTGTAIIFGDNLVAWESGNISKAGERSYFCCTRREVYINPCEHRDGTFTDNGDGTHSVSCQYCAVTKENHVADANGTCTRCKAKVQ